MAPLTPFWVQPSHPNVQKVLINKDVEFLTKSVSTIDLPPYGLFAKMNFPPCTMTDTPTYATVQMGEKAHLNLNSDLVYINHSCEPSVIFDTSSLSILAGPNGLKAGQELTFFYPSTEWDMAQGFDCFCNTRTCRGFISGAKNMSPKQLEGMWLNVHIRTLLEKHTATNGHANGSGTKHGDVDVSGNGEEEKDMNATKRRGVTSRELSGEMGGDTAVLY